VWKGPVRRADSHLRLGKFRNSFRVSLDSVCFRPSEFQRLSDSFELLQQSFSLDDAGAYNSPFFMCVIRVREVGSRRKNQKKLNGALGVSFLVCTQIFALLG
jgi:hypothetical protein